MKPIRVQRKRTKGWKMPENTVSVTRPGIFGNPFKVGEYVKIGKGEGKSLFTFLKCVDEKYNDGTFTKVLDNSHAVELFREYLNRYPLSQEKIKLLKGKNLACFCPLDKPCHADILLELANK